MNKVFFKRQTETVGFNYILTSIMQINFIIEWILIVWVMRTISMLNIAYFKNYVNDKYGKENFNMKLIFKL